MKKKILALTLVGALCMSMLTGCAQMAYTLLKNDTNESGTVEEYTEQIDVSEIPVFTEEMTEEVEPEEVTEEVQATEEVGAETPAEPASVDFEVAEGTLENPGKLGEWVATKTYAAEDETYHTIYYRITGVIRGAEAQQIVDDYNAEDNFVEFTELEQDDLEYCVVTYETHYPADFPQGEYGLYKSDVSLNVCNMEDSGAIEGYIGLSSVWDISEEPEEFHSGDTFTDGKAVFAMVKGFTDYMFCASYYENDSEYSSYVKAE